MILVFHSHFNGGFTFHDLIKLHWARSLCNDQRPHSLATMPSYHATPTAAGSLYRKRKPASQTNQSTNQPKNHQTGITRRAFRSHPIQPDRFLSFSHGGKARPSARAQHRLFLTKHQLHKTQPTRAADPHKASYTVAADNARLLSALDEDEKKENRSQQPFIHFASRRCRRYSPLSLSSHRLQLTCLGLLRSKAQAKRYKALADDGC